MVMNLWPTFLLRSTEEHSQVTPNHPDDSDLKQWKHKGEGTDSQAFGTKLNNTSLLTDSQMGIATSISRGSC